MTTTAVTVLPVPYYVQPTSVTCQSTCLKMMASYLEQAVVCQSTGAAQRDILKIWSDINTSPGRPDKNLTNSHANMKWWLEKHFPSLKFDYLNIANVQQAFWKIVGFIDAKMPVLMSVSHSRVAGHIVLVVGYESLCSAKDQYRVVVHDPYGQFHPSLGSHLYGKDRWLGGASLMSGGEQGPGRYCVLPISAVGRQRKEDHNLGHYILLSCHR